MVAVSSEKMSALSAERLRELLSFDPTSGVFTWRISPRASVKTGQVAGNINSRGYVAIGIDRRVYTAHRLAWLHAHGCWPKENLDHINGDRADNRLANLREASYRQNAGNRRISSVNKYGLKGISFESSSGKWRAQLYFKGKNKHLGRYDDPNDAHEAYVAAAKKFFGDFARVS